MAKNDRRNAGRDIGYDLPTGNLGKLVTPMRSLVPANGNGRARAIERRSRILQRSEIVEFCEVVGSDALDDVGLCLSQ